MDFFRTLATPAPPVTAPSSTSVISTASHRRFFADGLFFGDGFLFGHGLFFFSFARRFLDFHNRINGWLSFIQAGAHDVDGFFNEDFLARMRDADWRLWQGGCRLVTGESGSMGGERHKCGEWSCGWNFHWLCFVGGCGNDHKDSPPEQSHPDHAHKKPRSLRGKRKAIRSVIIRAVAAGVHAGKHPHTSPAAGRKSQQGDP